MIEFNVPAMSCGHCAGAITQALKLVDPQVRVEVDLSGKTVKVESTVSPKAIASALADAGYPPAA